MFESIQANSKLNELKSYRADMILKAYLASFLASYLLLLENDRSEVIDSISHADFSALSHETSELNFWGFVVNRLDKSKKFLRKEVAESINTTMGRIIEKRIKKIHRGISNGSITAEDFSISARILAYRFNLINGSTIGIIGGLTSWQNLDNAGKNKVLNKLLMLMLEGGVGNRLTQKIRTLANTAFKKNDKMKFSDFLRMKATGLPILGKLMKEDEGADAAQTASSDEATKSGDIAQNPYTFKDSKIIRRKIRKFKFVKFKAPKRLKIKKNNSIDANKAKLSKENDDK